MRYDRPMKKRSVSISGHRTSISLEEEFWTLLQDIAAQQDRPLARLIAEIDRNRMKAPQPANLSSALRVYVLHKALAGDTFSSQAKKAP